jgi:predicted amidophosphoribosyltransferase
MALEPCKECSKEISTLAKSCPNCGAPNDNVEKLKFYNYGFGQH